MSWLRRFVESLENDLTIRAKTTEVSIKDFSATSYATIFEEEVFCYIFLLHFTFRELAKTRQTTQYTMAGIGKQH
jgi:U3 small nucleolar RNA-associated protein 19